MRILSLVLVALEVPDEEDPAPEFDPADPYADHEAITAMIDALRPPQLDRTTYEPVVSLWDVQWAIREAEIVRVPYDESNPEHQATGAAEHEAIAACPRCGSVKFRYEEGALEQRDMHENYGHTLIFEGDGFHGDGDDIPGVVCCTCGIALSGVGADPESVVAMDWL